MVKKPPTPRGRNRILKPEEKVRLLNELEPIGKRSIWMKPLVEFALETAMRRGEILGLLWTNVNLKDRTAFLELTKNGDSRTVPLSSRAVQILQNLPRDSGSSVFPINHASVSANFNRARKRANLEDFHFHDLRHTAITHLAKKLPNVLELAAVSGHKELRMLKRYHHPNPVELAIKIG
jgi:integrase